MKLLWHSNAPYAPTGYGNQTGLFAPGVAEHYDTAISSFYGLEGAPIIWHDIPVFPGLGGTFGNEFLGSHAQKWFEGDLRGGLVLTLMDVWVLDPQMVAQLNACCWVPVDHEPVPPAVHRFFANSGAIPLAMSRFGEQELSEFDPLYVPHGVNADVFKPCARAEVREAFGLPQDAFIVGMVAANKGAPSRKGFQQAFEAFRAFRERHDDAYLYLHTTMNPGFAQGENLGELLASLQIPEESLLIADQYRMMYDPVPARMMAHVYSSLDVLLNPAHGEGFGIPVLEAQACGIPAIVTDFSAMKEVCGAGWKVGARPFWTGQRSWQAIPDVEELAASMEECYGLSETERKALSKKARAHALDYAAEKVLREHFLPALTEVCERIGIEEKERVAA